MTQQDIIYYDIDILNTDFQQTEKNTQIEFQETRNSPFIDKAEDYFMSIVRFELSDTSTLPVFIPEIEPNQEDINKTIYQLSLTNNVGTSGIITVIYVPFTADQQIFPQSPVGRQQENTPYYHVYNYNQFLKAINIAFINALDALYPGGIPTGVTPPFLEIDPVTKKLSLYALASAYYTLDSTKIKININAPLKRLLNSFQFVDFGFGNPAFPLPYTFYLDSMFQHGNVVKLDVGGASLVPYFKMTSQDLDIVTWNPISSVVFTSSYMPVSPTNTSTPSVILYNSGNNRNTASIVTDFQVNITADNSYRQNLLYSPTSEYRLFSLFSSQPLNSIDIRVWWKDKFGRLNPLTNPGGAFANMKIMFRRKAFNNL